jgi:outer membrane protein
MKKSLLLLILSSYFALEAATLDVGIVSFRRCVEQSKIGKKEQSNFENSKAQMTEVITKLDKELEELASKLGNEEFLESLSQESQNELKLKFQQLNQEMGRVQNHYYQIMNQNNFQMAASLNNKVAEASTAVAETKKLQLVLNEEAAFYRAPSLDITDAVIVEMDKRFDAIPTK